jgi:hypothetical protein
MDACFFTAFFRTGLEVAGCAALSSGALGGAIVWLGAVETEEVTTAGLLFCWEQPMVSSKITNKPATTSLLLFAPACFADAANSLAYVMFVSPPAAWQLIQVEARHRPDKRL